ncbi:MAG: thiamine diphosphokinase [Actinobacteria bacterium]|nr:thiamine diphosphokinase [Actinomycetota bacterium]
MSKQNEIAARAAIIVMGGVAPDLGLAAALESNDVIVIAADSGAVHAHAAGLSIDIVVGDFDSIPPLLLQQLEGAGVRVERHPAAKDATDLELAIDVAIREGAGVVTVVGGHGGRVDQSLANAFVIASSAYAHISMHAILDSALVSVVHGGGGVTFVGAPGDVVTILPLHGDATGVRTEGLEYPLRGETLKAGTTRGVSNVLLAREATVSLESGTVLVVRPGPELLVSEDGEN